MTDDLLKRLRSVLGARYDLEREIGRGGMAAVFLAEDRKHARPVAIKVLHPELAAAIGGDRFLREINIAAHLRHPHIVPLLDSGEAEGLLYYVMPYVEGESLRQRLVVRGPLQIPEAIRYWRDVVDAIAYAHRQAILHRDIKPENVLIDERHASLVDFGIGKAFGQIGGTHTLTTIGMAIGTPAYMAPEQAIASDEIDHRADIYALGVLAYEMLTGRVPFGSSTPAQIAAKMSAPAPDVRENCPDASPELAEVIKRCLEPEPESRWQSADDLLKELESVATPNTRPAATAWRRVTSSPRRKKRAVAALSLALITLAAVSYIWVSHARERTWARETGIPEIRRLADAAINDSAFLIASRVRAVLAADPELDSLLARVSTTATLHSHPEGARVYWTAYRGDTTDWKPLGVTPLNQVAVPLPRAQVTLLLKYEKPGFHTSLRPLEGERRASSPVVLDPTRPTTGDVVRVRGGVLALPSPARASGDSVLLPDFYMERFEVTNRQFKEFVVAGGYRRRDLWQFAFTTPQGDLSWDEAMSRFRDKTGRPGPASWEGGDIPPGRDNYPVSGISWYEAQAYARFAGKRLPTIFHWRQAAQLNASSSIVPSSNMERSALAPVGAFSGMTPYGVFDMAGNVREWCVNADGEKRYILGGGFSDQGYIFSDAITADPFDRSDGNGLRLMQSVPGSRSGEELDPFARPAPRGFRDYTAERSFSEVEFRSFLPIFEYDRLPLNAVVESTDSSSPRWIKQTIEFDAAYGQERIRAYFFLPRNVRPPYQPSSSSRLQTRCTRAPAGSSSRSLTTSSQMVEPFSIPFTRTRTSAVVTSQPRWEPIRFTT